MAAPSPWQRLFAGTAGLLLAGQVFMHGQTPALDLQTILVRVGAQLEQHFQRAQRIVSTEAVWVRSFTREMRATGSARELEFEHRVEWGVLDEGGVPTVTVHRELQSVDGRGPTQEDLDACLTPVSVDVDPLSALLPARQAEFTFTLDGLDEIDGRQVARLDYVPRAVGPEEITWEEDCVSLSLPGRSSGRAWVDVQSGDVLRLDERLMGRFEFYEPEDRPRERWEPIVLERSESSIRYQRVSFEDPAETLMLPRAIESSWTLLGTGFVPRYVRSQEYADHRRFVTEGRIREPRR